MQFTREQKTMIRDAMAALYPSVNIARRVLWDAGLETVSYDLSGDAQTFWTAIVQKADDNDDLGAIVAVARKEYPKNALLRALDAPVAPAVPAAPAAPLSPSSGSVRGPDVAPRTTTVGPWRVSTVGVVDFRKLSGPQWAALQRALVDAFPTFQDLAELVRWRLEQNLHGIASSQNVSTAVYELIQWSQARGLTARLYHAACAERRDHAALAEFGLAVVAPVASAAPTSVEGSSLERVLRKAAPQLKLVDLLRQLGEAQGRVCRVDIEGRAMGTGFLIGPSAVMTNHHVVAKVLSGQLPPSTVALRFDLHPGDEGTLVRLDELDWRIDASPPADFELRGGAGEVDVEHLDYAILRVVGKPGEAPIGGEHATPSARKRGWYTLPAQEVLFRAEKALYLVQHPDGRSMEFAMEMEGGATVNASRTRVAHRVNTERGSSGSPVFTLDGELVALHHAGSTAIITQGNEAVPLDTIRARLALKGLLDEVASR